MEPSDAMKLLLEACYVEAVRANEAEERVRVLETALRECIEAFDAGPLLAPNCEAFERARKLLKPLM